MTAGRLTPEAMDFSVATPSIMSINHDMQPHLMGLRHCTCLFLVQ